MFFRTSVCESIPLQIGLDITKEGLRNTNFDIQVWINTTLPFTTPIDIFLKSIVKGLIRYSGTSTCRQFNTSLRI